MDAVLSSITLSPSKDTMILPPLLTGSYVILGAPAGVRVVTFFLDREMVLDFNLKLVSVVFAKRPTP